jgi:D-amino peptidase
MKRCALLTWRLSVLLVAALSVQAQTGKSVFIITDAEGVDGVCRQDQTDPNNQEMRQLLAGEINAAVQGFFEGGASDVLVWDGHDGGRTLSALTIDPRTKLIMGNLGPTMTFDRHYSAVAFVGQHARANTLGGVMAHSYSSLGIQTILMNGKPVGEIETRTALAGWFGVPVIFLSGDEAAARDLHAIVPNAQTAVVKEGLANYTCISLTAKAAQALIREGARRAMAKIADIHPYRVEGPITFQIEYTSRNAPAIKARTSGGADVVDARTIRYHGKNFIEAWTSVPGISN